MSRIILVIAVLLLGLGVAQWQKKRDRLQTADTSIYGFVEINPPDGVSAHKVLLLTPPDCPRERTSCAGPLFDALQQDGIPVERFHRYSSDIENPTPAQRAKNERLRVLRQRTGVLVLINGWAKVDPSVDDVKGEFLQRVPSGG